MISPIKQLNIKLKEILSASTMNNTFMDIQWTHPMTFSCLLRPSSTNY